MPNYQTTTLVLAPEVAAAFMRDSTVEERTKGWDPAPDRVVDFNLVIPAPDHTDPMFTATYYPDAMGGGWGMDGYSPLDWNRDHWGTKWNAGSQHYEPVAGDLVRLRFDTAWSCPFPVLTALSKQFPDEVIEVQTVGEDHGSGVAIFKLKGGEEFDVFQPEEYSDEANEAAAQMQYGKTYAEVRAEWEDA